MGSPHRIFRLRRRLRCGAQELYQACSVAFPALFLKKSAASPFSAFGRMEKAMKEIKQRLEGGKQPPPKSGDDV
jgi:hypothetical protein